MTLTRTILIPALLFFVCITSTLAGPAEDFEVEFGSRMRPQTVLEKTRLMDDLLQAARFRTETDYRIYVATRLHELARQRREDYGHAARALGILEELQPDKSREILTKLLELYQKAYGANKATNLGIGMGTMEVHLRLAGLITRDVNEKIAHSDLTPDQYADDVQQALVQVKMAQGIGFEVMNRVKSYEQMLLGKADQARALQALQEFHMKLDEAIPRVLERVENLERYHRTCTEFSRYKKQLDREPGHQAAAEKLVSLCLTELDDPHRAQAYAKVGLAEGRQALLPLLGRPIRSVGPAQALAIGQWYQELAKTAQSTSRPLMLVSARLYFAHHQAMAAPEDDGPRQTSRAALTAVDAELSRLVDNQLKLATLMDERSATLNPEAVVIVTTVVTPEDVQPDITPSGNDPAVENPQQEPETVPATEPAPAAPRRPVTALPEKEILNTGKSIFDFGRD